MAAAKSSTRHTRGANLAKRRLRPTSRIFPTAAGLTAALVVLAACGSPTRIDKAGALEHAVTTVTLEVPDSGAPEGMFFAEDVSKRSHGKLKVVIDSSTYPSTDPANGARLVAAMRSGQVAFSYEPARDWVAAGVAAFEALNSPFLVTTFSATASLANSSLAHVLLSQLSSLGLVGLGMIPSEPRQILSVTPLFAASAFHGVSLRINDNPEAAALVTAMGATPVQGLSAYDTGEALQGEIEGAETSPLYILTNSYNAEAPFLTTYALFPRLDTIVATKSAWAALTQADQSAMRQAVADTLINSRQAPARESAELGTLCAAGLVLDQPSTAQLSALSQEALRATPRGAQIASIISEIRSAIPGTGPQLDAVPPPTTCHVAHTVKEANGFASTFADQSIAPPASPARPSTESIPTGVYVTTDTVADFRAGHQLGADWSDAQTFTLTLFADGIASETEEPTAEDVFGSYVVKGDEVTFTWLDAGLTPETVRWSYLNGLLTLTVVDVQDTAGRVMYSAHPWRKVG